MKEKTEMDKKEKKDVILLSLRRLKQLKINWRGSIKNHYRSGAIVWGKAIQLPNWQEKYISVLLL